MTSQPLPHSPAKGKAVPLVRSKKQIEAAAAAALGAEAAELAQDALTKEQEVATQLAQIVNLHLAGHSLHSIGLQIGATAEEVDRLLAKDAARYVRSQPALRVWTRNWVSERYTKLLDTVWKQATDEKHAEMLESQDRAVKILDRLSKLHGAEAPTQTEVTVDAAPDAVEALIAKLASAQGQGYDTDIFDTVPGTVVHEAAEAAPARTLASSQALEQPQAADPQEGL